MTLNPKYEFVRQPCGTCGGAGRLPMKHSRGFYTWSQQRRHKPSCGDCSGHGYHDIRRERLDLGWDAAALPPHERKEA